ncbi:MAG: hypothetical protein AAFO94_17910, partial [Bacteroidota bacterium]
ALSVIDPTMCPLFITGICEISFSFMRSITESAVLSHLLKNPMDNSESQVSSIMGEAFPMVNEDIPCRQLNRYISKKIPAVIARDKAGTMHIITQYDILQAV